MTFKPKIELHLHLEGAAPPEFIRRLAGEKKVDLAGVFDERGSYDYKDFEGFLKVYEAATAVLQSPDDYGRLTRTVLEASREQGVVYTEAFLSPDFCGGRDVSAWREYLHAMQEAAQSVDGIEMRGIVTCIRHFGPEKAREAAICARETAGDFVTGFGMGGNEAVLSQADFAWAFDCARESGLGLTTHAGEFGGPESVRDALDTLRVTRIGHGVRAIEDLALVDRLIEDDITLEVNPGSNVALGVYRDWAAHPIERLRERGVKVTVSTDDPPFFHTDMTREYDMLERTFGWDDEVFRAVNRTAAEAAFCDAPTRAKLLKALEA
ncbi:adenosine deaminase [Jannaschia pohangensis]|uniref:Adenosine deaminase n=1 Tax=Jannaschia pohangensis TaxID=390807 RepID=A0A1I3IA78_9RHOB|nr:adenosine deaminase [Jannaschia pohangensis]SFI44852.1 adenosine deaminase [Jannaschia pohangensis]